MSSEKVRVLMFSVFLFLLLIFAVVYSPTNALSHAANPDSFMHLPVGKPLPAKASVASLPDNLGPPPDLAENKRAEEK
jgi:hypothetical protein